MKTTSRTETRHSMNRAMLGVRWKWLKNRRCRKYGHRISASMSQGQMGGAYWPICTRCGYAVEPPR